MFFVILFVVRARVTAATKATMSALSRCRWAKSQPERNLAKQQYREAKAEAQKWGAIETRVLQARRLLLLPFQPWTWAEPEEAVISLALGPIFIVTSKPEGFVNTVIDNAILALGG